MRNCLGRGGPRSEAYLDLGCRCPGCERWFSLQGRLEELVSLEAELVLQRESEVVVSGGPEPLGASGSVDGWGASHFARALAESSSGGWRSRAACRVWPTAWWFEDEFESQAVKICGGCPVKDECLETAFEVDNQFGVWGGKTRGERRRMQRNGHG